MATTPDNSPVATAPIPGEQWDLPVGYDANGELLTLQQAKNLGAESIRTLAAVSPEQRVEVVLKRIEAQPKLELAMIGAGMVDKERALREVRAQSEVGRALIEIEQRLIRSLLEVAWSK